MTSKELKRRARTVLEGKYSFATSLTTTLLLFTITMNYLLQASGFSRSPQPMYQAFFWILWAIMTLLIALLEIGLIKFLYSLSLGTLILHPGILLYAFRNQPDTFILTSGFRYLVSLVWFIPAGWRAFQLPLDTLELTELPAALLPILGLALAAVIPAVLVSMPFCMTNYVLLDDPNCSALEALRTSCQLMKGQNKRVLLLWISFLPMFLLALGSYGVGLLWVRPYYHTTMNQLYLELTGRDTELVAAVKTEQDETCSQNF